jgi:hypothetical protein
MRLSETEVESLVQGTIAVIEYEFKQSDPEAAEQCLDWTVWKLFDDGYISVAFELVEAYKILRLDLYYGGGPDI